MAGEQSRINGQKGGRPKDPTSENYRKTLLKEVKEQQNELAKALIAKGLSGDIPALREINDRVLGKSSQDIDLTTGGQEIKLTLLRYDDGNSPAVPVHAPEVPAPPVESGG